MPSLSPALVRSIPFGIYAAFLVVTPWLSPYLPDSRWLYLVKVSCVATALVLLAPQIEELRDTWKISGREWLQSLAIGIVIFVLWINLDQPWATMGAPIGFDPRHAGGKIDYPLAGIRIAGATIVVPVMEELFWRSFIMRWIEKTDFCVLAPGALAWRGLLVSSALFGIEHNLWLAGLLAGVAYGWLYIRSGNLKSPVIAHAVTNFLLGGWVLYSGQWQFW